MVTLEIMDEIDAFKGLDKDQLKQVQEYCKICNFKKGERLFSEGEDATDLWFMLAGKIDMRFDLPGRPTSKENNIASITKYHAFGWSCFVPPNKYRLSAYCSSETCKIIKIKRVRLERLFKKDAYIGYTFMSYLINVVGERFHQFQDDVAKRRGEDIISGW